MLFCKAQLKALLKQDVKYTALSLPIKPVLFSNRKRGFRGLAPFLNAVFLVLGCDNSKQHLFTVYFFLSFFFVCFCFCGIRSLSSLCVQYDVLSSHAVHR